MKMQQLNTIINLYKDNPMLFGLFSMYLLSIVTYLGKDLPKTFFGYIKTHLITSATLENAGWYNQDVYNNFLVWSNTKVISWLSRTVSLERSGDSISIGPGYGFHVLKYKGKLFWFVIEKQDSSGSEKQKKIITISSFNRDKKIIHDMFEEISEYKETKESFVYNVDGDYWNKGNKVHNRNLKSMMLDSSIIDKLTSSIDKFIDSKDWYEKNGISYKLGIMLYGLPGYGKSSIIRALATLYKRNIYVLSLSGLSDTKLKAFMSTVKENSFILFEDFDSFLLTHTRTGDMKPENVDLNTNVTMSGLLNAIDGVDSQQDLITFFTTNHIESIDPAFLRPGRADVSLEIKLHSNEPVYSYLSFIYDTDIQLIKNMFNAEVFINISPAIIENIVKGNINNLNKTISEIKDHIVV